MLIIPLAVLALVMTGAPSEMSIVTDKLALPVAFTAEIVTTVDDKVVGVPEITPLLMFKVSPAGNAVELKLVGLLVAVIW